jgi:hypothetical protein
MPDAPSTPHAAEAGSTPDAGSAPHAADAGSTPDAGSAPHAADAGSTPDAGSTHTTEAGSTSHTSDPTSHTDGGDSGSHNESTSQADTAAPKDTDTASSHPDGTDAPKDGGDAPKETDAPKDTDTPKDGGDAPKDTDAPKDGGETSKDGADAPKDIDAPKDGGDTPKDGGEAPKDSGNEGNPPRDGNDGDQPLHDENGGNDSGGNEGAKTVETSMDDPSATWKGDGEGADRLPGLDGMKPDEVKAMVDNSDLPAETKVKLQEIIDGETPLTTNKEKGNFGELMQDIYYREQGYTAIHQNPVTGLDGKGHQGIDGVYYKADGHPPYIIAEAKFTGDGSAPSMGKTLSGPQMGVQWIKDRIRRNSLGLSDEHLEALTQALKQDTGQLGSRLFHVDGSGNVKESSLNLGGRTG